MADEEDALFSSSRARIARPAAPMLPLCDSCGLYRAGCHSPKMPVFGSGKRKIMIIGERPGAAEDKAGRPFAGGSGQLLERRLAKCGVDMDRDCWLTNAFICKPPDGEVKHDSAKAVESCRPNVLKAIRDYDPVVIILAGHAAAKSVIGHAWKSDVGAIARWVGYQVPCHAPNAWLCPVYNPAHLMWGNDKKKDEVLDAQFTEHLRAVVQLTERPWPDGPPDFGAQVRLIHSPDEAARALDRYRAGAVAFDFETTTLKPDGPHADIVCASVCWEGEETIAFPWHGAAREAMAELLTDSAVAKDGWNIKFEHRWTRAKLGVEVRGWRWDGMLAAHALDPRGNISSLKFQSFRRYGLPDHAHHIAPMFDSGDSNAPNRIRDIELPLIMRYCGIDSLMEYRIDADQMKELGYDN